MLIYAYALVCGGHALGAQHTSGSLNGQKEKKPEEAGY